MLRPIVPAAAPGRTAIPPFARPDQPFAEKGGQRHSFTLAIGVSFSEGSHLRGPEAVMAEEYRSLMARYQAGDAAAFESLYGLLAPELRRLALGVRHGSPADDVVEQVFTELHRARRSYDPRKPFEPWLTAIVAHVMEAGRRSRLKRRTFRGLLDRLAAPGNAGRRSAR